jgi:hypothetical protein
MANERLKYATALVTAQALLEAMPELLLACRESRFLELFRIVKSAIDSFDRIQLKREVARPEPSLN